MTAIAVAELSSSTPAFAESGQVQSRVKEALVDQIEHELSIILEDFNSVPSRAGLFEVGTIAEVVVLGKNLPSGHRFAQLIRGAGLRWIAGGLFEDVCFSEAQLVYHTTLLLQFAGPVPSDILQALSHQGMIGRSEWPTLTQLCISTMLNQCGVELPLPETEITDLTACLDKRCLRAQSSEYDLALLLTTAQLLQDPQIARTRPLLLKAAPRILPRVLLVQALRSKNWNWASVLAFLCCRAFGLPPYLDQTLRRALGEIPARLENFDLPKEISEQSEYFSRSVRALRLRSAAALALYMDCCQDS